MSKKRRPPELPPPPPPRAAALSNRVRESLAVPAGGAVARPLVGPPEDLGMAEGPLMTSIAIRVGQLFALARVTAADRAAHAILTRATDHARAKPARLLAADLPDEAHVARVAEQLARTITDRFLPYAREYDADDNDVRTRELARLFVVVFARALAKYVTEGGP